MRISFSCSILISVLDLVKFLEDDRVMREGGGGDGGVEESMAPSYSEMLAYVVFASCIISVVVLFGSFFVVQYGHYCRLSRGTSDGNSEKNIGVDDSGFRTARGDDKDSLEDSIPTVGEDVNAVTARGHRTRFSGGQLEPVIDDDGADALPEDWLAFEDEHFNTYYHNVKTLESTWTRPASTKVAVALCEHLDGNTEIELTEMKKEDELQQEVQFVQNPAQYLKAHAKRRLLDQAKLVSQSE